MASLQAGLRRWHRWISTALGLFLLVMAATGTVLQIQFLIHGFPADPPADAPPRVAVLPVDHAGDLVGRVLAAAAGSRPGAAPTQISLRATGADIVAEVEFTSGPPVAFDARTLRPLAGRPPPPGSLLDQRLHTLLFRIHTGQAFGGAGTILTLGCGLALLFLAFSGLMLWGGLAQRRATAGRRSPFWR